MSKNFNRLHYLDALRGGGILTVIYHHFIVMGMRDSGYTSHVSNFIITFFMPLFFFISGYFGMRLLSTQTASQVWSKIRSNIENLLIPTIVVFMLCMVWFNLDPIKWLFASYKSGYWFTWALFFICSLFALISYITNKINSRRTIWVHIFLSLAMFLLSKKINESIPVVGMLSLDLICEYYLFYSYGAFFHTYEDKILNLIGNKYISALLFIAFVTPGFFTLRWFIYLPCQLCQVTFLYLLFYHYRNFFHEQNVFAKGLCTIGRYTLPIYFLHYFLLFKIDFLCTWLTSFATDYCFRGHSCGFIVELAIVGTIAVAIAGICILIRKLIQPFPLVSHLLFGKA